MSRAAHGERSRGALRLARGRASLARRRNSRRRATWRQGPAERGGARAAAFISVSFRGAEPAGGPLMSGRPAVWLEARRGGDRHRRESAAPLGGNSFPRCTGACGQRAAFPPCQQARRVQRKDNCTLSFPAGVRGCCLPQASVGRGGTDAAWRCFEHKQLRKEAGGCGGWLLLRAMGRRERKHATAARKLAGWSNHYHLGPRHHTPHPQPAGFYASIVAPRPARAQQQR